MPAKLVNPLLFLIAKTTHSKLAHQIEYLKAENKILRARVPKHIRTTKKERLLLLKAGKKLGSGLRHLITIVTYTAFLRWQRDTEKTRKRGKSGRPKTPDEVIELILQMARDNDWGFGRIQGELKTLGIKLSRTTIKKILLENGLDPCPEHTRGSWAEFIKRHAETIWACDFISSRILTKTGFAHCFILFFINIKSRKVHLGGITTQPSSEWMAQQSRNLCMLAQEQSQKRIFLLHDGDGKFTPQFRRILKDQKHKPIKLPAHSPNLNAYAERWVRSLRNECLNHFWIFGQSHMRHLVEEYIRYYNEIRPHQGIGNRRIGATSDPPVVQLPGKIEARAWLGGLLKNYSRQAA